MKCLNNNYDKTIEESTTKFLVLHTDGALHSTDKQTNTQTILFLNPDQHHLCAYHITHVI